MADLNIIYQKLQIRKASVQEDIDALDQAIQGSRMELESLERLLSASALILAESEYIFDHTGQLGGS